MVAEQRLPETHQTAEALVENGNETFQWTKQWYPVAVAAFLEAAKPHAIELLGKNLVLWRDGSGEWHCFEDFCPHRGAPLSEGRVEKDGTLLCSYHAWRFLGSGQCTHIPQSFDRETEAKHLESDRACAIAYPTQEKQGLLWVWAESGTQAHLDSQQRAPRLVPELEEKSERVVISSWNVRDLPYGWDFFMENTADPAHVPASHHGLVANRYKDTKYYDMIPVRQLTVQDGFAYEIKLKPDDPMQGRGVHDFQPPCHMRIEFSGDDGSQLNLILYAIPTRPGWCRHIGCQVLIKNQQGKLPRGLAFFALPMPIWLGHVLSSMFLHQDLVLLHHQQKNLAKKGRERWAETVYTPNPQDKMVVAFRQWMKYKAGGEIPWEANGDLHLPPAEIDKRKLFDVWSTHTQHCSVCQRALKNFNRASILAYGASAGCFGLALWLDARAIALKVETEQLAPSVSVFSVPPTASFWAAVGAAIVLAVVGTLVKKFSRLFYVYEFDHSQND